MDDTILLEMTPDQFVEVVDEALKLCRRGQQEGNWLALGQSPLAHCSLVTESVLAGEGHTPDVRGRILRSVLQWGIDKLRPSAQPDWSDFRWRNYNVLYYPYIEASKQLNALPELLGIEERGVFSSRERAVAVLAEILQAELASPQDGWRRKQYALVEWYEQYSPDIQLLLRVLTIFAQPIPIRFIHDLLPAQAATITTSIHQLIQDGVLQSEEQATAVILYADIREYLVTLLSPDERATWHDAAAQYYVEQCNYLEAIRHWQVINQAEAAADLFMRHFQPLLDQCQPATLQTTLAWFQASMLPEPVWRELKIIAGQVAEAMEDVDTGLAEYAEAMAAADLPIKVRAIFYRAKLLKYKNIEESLAHFIYGIQLAARLPATNPLLAELHIARAFIFLHDQQDLARALTDLQAAENHLPKTEPDKWILLHNAWAGYYYYLSQPDAEIEHRFQAWLLALEMQDKNLMARMAHNLAQRYSVQGEYQLAEQYFQESKQLAEETGDQNRIGLNALNLGANYFRQAAYEQALVCYTQAYDIFAGLKNKNWLARACYNLAEVYANLGDVPNGRAFYAEGVEIAQNAAMEEILTALQGLTAVHPWLLVTLKSRQEQAIAYVKKHGAIQNKQYRSLVDVGARTAIRDLEEMEQMGLLVREGKGRATRYILGEGSVDQPVDGNGE